MHGPNRNSLQGKRQPPHSFSVPEPHNDVGLTPVQPEPAAPKGALWPLLAIILGLILTAIWAGVLAWLAVELAIKLSAWLFT